MGDSFVWGPPYITLNHLWWRQLAIELERRGYHQVDVVAAGHPGWSTRRQLECAQQLIPRSSRISYLGICHQRPGRKDRPANFPFAGPAPLWPANPPAASAAHSQSGVQVRSLRANKLAEQYTGPEYGYAYPDWELRLLEDENFERYRGQFEKSRPNATIGSSAFLLTLPHCPGREYFEPRYGRS